MLPLKSAKNTAIHKETNTQWLEQWSKGRKSATQLWNITKRPNMKPASNYIRKLEIVHTLHGSQGSEPAIARLTNTYIASTLLRTPCATAERPSRLSHTFC